MEVTQAASRCPENGVEYDIIILSGQIQMKIIKDVVVSRIIIHDGD